jgi:four helix bundle protein
MMNLIEEYQEKYRIDPKAFARKLEDRTTQFAVRIIKLSAKLPNTIECKIVRNQLAKAGTSIGANYSEANRARSRADFKNKIKICESESSETLYWLTIVKLMNWLRPEEIEGEYNEAKEFLALFTAIGKTTYENSE